MRKRLIVNGALIAAGVIINVLVAWACALWRPVQSGPMDMLVVEGADAWVFERSPFALPHGCTVDHYAAFGGAGGLRLEVVSIAEPGADDSAQGEAWGCVAIEAGFPLTSLRGEVWRHDFDSAGRGHEELRRGVRELSPSLAESLGTPRTMLPATPLWPGSVVNSLCYAGVLWLLIVGPITVRRILRERVADSLSSRCESRENERGAGEAWIGPDAR